MNLDTEVTCDKSCWVKNLDFFLTICFPVIIGVSVTGYFEYQSVVGCILSIVISSIIVYGLLMTFRRQHRE